MTSLVEENGRQCMPCSTKFLLTLRNEILSRETPDFLKQTFLSQVIYISVSGESKHSGREALQLVLSPFCMEI